MSHRNLNFFAFSYCLVMSKCKAIANVGAKRFLTYSNSIKHPNLSDFDSILLDMDGVIWRGTEPIEGSIEALHRLTDLGKRLLFITNHSGKTKSDVVHKLTKWGFDKASEDNVVTSSSVTASYLKIQFDNMEKKLQQSVDRCVYMVGNPALHHELLKVNITVVQSIASDPFVDVDEFSSIPLDPRVRCVVVGWDQGFTYRKLATASLYLQKNPGCMFVITNPDSADKVKGNVLMPGVGPLAEAISVSCGVSPIVCGKPSQVIVDHVLELLGGISRERVLMVGDRLDTDVSFANAAGFASCVVMTGCTSHQDLETHFEQCRFLPINSNNRESDELTGKIAQKSLDALLIKTPKFMANNLYDMSFTTTHSLPLINAK